MPEEKLSKYLSPLGVWALAFGCSVGWGAFIMPGTTFLPTAGTFGTAVGLFIGLFIMLIIAANYNFMMNKYPDVGGIFTYTKKTFGYDHGFLSSWFLILTYIAITWANATALPIIARYFFGDTFQFAYLYTIAGFDVYLAEVLLSIFAIIISALLCIGKKNEIKFIQIFLACLLFAGILICAFDTLSANQGGLETFKPKYFPADSEITQILGIIMLAPWAFVGFESVSHSAAEFNFDIKKSFSIMAAALISATFAYIILAETAISIIPSRFETWVNYILNLNTLIGYEKLPTAYAIYMAMGDFGIKILSATVFAGVMTGLIGNYIGVSRLLYSMAKDNLLPKFLGKLNNNNVPGNAILLIMTISLAIPFFGRTAIGWIIDINTVGATIAYCYTSAAAYVIARRENNSVIKITGLIGVIVSLGFNLCLLIPNIWGKSFFATESYLMLVLWSIIGFCVFRYVFKRDDLQRFGKSVVSWVVMLFLIFFCSLIWMRQSTDKSLAETVLNVSKFYEAEIDRFGYNLNTYRKYQEKKYLEDQMDSLQSSMMKDSIIQMLIMLFSLFVMFNIYSIMMKREKDAQQAQIQAEENSKAKTTFLSNMSHDIRTPMNAIIGYTTLIKKEKNLPARAIDYLDKIESSNKHLLALINDILDMSRIESGKMELDIDKADLSKAMNDVRDLFATQMVTKSIDYNVDVEIVDKFVMCDVPRLNRVLLNLISNAYKFTPEGGKVKVSLIQVGTDDNLGSYELRVKDTGMGMSPEFAAKVFEAYERDRSVTNIQGTGLGMAITKSIVELMGGTIEVKSELGKGTEFIVHVDFPIVEDENISADNTEQENISTDIDFSRIKLLLVEDNEVNREIASLILTEYGFKLDTAENGKIAVDKIADSKPGDFQAVLMDIQMPVMNGYEATKKIRALDNPELANIPIIAMTANAFTEDIQAAKDSGMNSHIAKPIDIAKMIETLTEVLR